MTDKPLVKARKLATVTLVGVLLWIALEYLLFYSLRTVLAIPATLLTIVVNGVAVGMWVQDSTTGKIVYGISALIISTFFVGAIYLSLVRIFLNWG